MLKILKKAASWEAMQPGEWFLDAALADQEKRTGSSRVSVRCPVCKLRTHLNVLHRIDAQGRVTASCMCPRMTCGDGIARCTWHEFITLEGWTPEDAANAR